MHDNVTDGGNMSMQARPGATNQTASMVRASKAVGALLVAIALTGCASASPSASAPGSAASSPPGDPDAIRIGAVFPLHGNAAGLAAQELRGVQIAAEFANADGGIGGRRVIVDVRDLASRDDAATVMAQLKAEGVGVVVGAYSSDLSMAASEAADEAGLVYWEAGAVADQLTGRGLPMVFRVGASGTNLGSNSASFAARVLTPRLGKASRAALRLAIVAAEDDYARSVADAAAKAAGSAGLDIVTRQSYNLTLPQWPKLMAELVRQLPDVVILASHIPDGIAFRRATAAVTAAAEVPNTQSPARPRPGRPQRVRPKRACPGSRRPGRSSTRFSRPRSHAATSARPESRPQHAASTCRKDRYPTAPAYASRPSRPRSARTNARQQ